MNKNFDILGLGSVLTDELVLLPEFPQADSKIEIINTQKQLGGPVPIALKTLSALGLKTSFVGKVGGDSNSSYIKNKLAESTINSTNLITQKDAESGFSQIWIDSRRGTRTIAYSSGSLSPISKDEINFNSLPVCKMLHVDGRNHGAAKVLIDFYRKSGSIISIDTGNFREQTLELLNLVDIIIMPKRFPQELFREVEQDVLIRKCSKRFINAKLIVITDGVNGSICSYRNEVLKQKAFEVQTVDSTGAGDVHAAGILFGMAEEWGVGKTLEFAAAVAAFKCTSIGNATLPNCDRVRKFIKEYKVLQGVT